MSDTYAYPMDVCEWCEGVHQGGPLGFLDCPACKDPATCPHPSQRVYSNGFDCDACGYSERAEVTP